MMKEWILEHQTVIHMDTARAQLLEIAREGKVLTHGAMPLYGIKLRSRSGQSQWIWAGEGTFAGEKDDVYLYHHEQVEVCLSVKCADGALHSRLRVQNHTKLLIEQVELLPVGVFGKLKGEPGGRGAIVFPYNEGCLVTDMDKRNWSPFPYMEPEYPSLGKYAVFPNMICAQFLAYILDGTGIYLGMHDEGRTTKHIDFRSDGDSIRLQLRTFCDADYGCDYEMPFDCVLQTFEGQWQDACQLYRQWFEGHLPRDLKPIAEENLPDWYSNSPIVVTYPVRGKFDTDVMDPNGLYPYENALPHLRTIAEETNSQVMTLLMHWEGTAPWAPPYVWPPYGGEEQFARFVDTVHKERMLIGLYCSGMGWTQQSALVRSYDRRADFEAWNVAQNVCTNSDGSYRSEICKPQREGLDLCPASDFTKQAIAGEAKKMADSGVDYIQLFDQNHGGCSYFCYSDRHGHSPAPGKWQQEHTNKLLEAVQRPGVLFGCESAAAEPFLGKLKFSDNRYELNYYIGLPIPMYSYLYHPYVNNFMGNQICMMLSKEAYNYSYRVAYSFIAGDMLTAVLTDTGEISLCWGNECFRDVADKKTALTVLKNLNAWRTGSGKNYLHMGKMVKPLTLHCGKKRFMGEDGRPIEDDEVLTARYEYRGACAQFAANYTLSPVTVHTDVPVTVYMDPALQTAAHGVCSFTVPPLSAVMLTENDG